MASIEGVATAKGETTDVELSRTQQTIARRMAESKATIPDFTLQIDVDMEECVALRAELKRISHTDGHAAATSREPLKTPTYNDMVVKACALALREHPRANGSYRDGRLQLHSRVNVGVAVAAASALVVPTVFDADEKSLGEIARETHTLAERVRARHDHAAGARRRHVHGVEPRHVRRAELHRDHQPAAGGILSVGARRAARGRARRAGGRAHTMTLTLACDHRILYGAEAAQFLARIRELLETPSALTLVSVPISGAAAPERSRLCGIAGFRRRAPGSYMAKKGGHNACTYYRSSADPRACGWLGGQSTAVPDRAGGGCRVPRRWTSRTQSSDALHRSSVEYAGPWPRAHH